MANYQVLKNSIMQVIKQNGNEEITGDLLQQTLIAMVNTIGNGYNFKGLLSRPLTPPVTDTNVFYVVNTPGEYTNYGPDMRVLPNEIAIFKYDGQWHKDLVLNDRFVDFSTAQIINNIKTFAVGLNAPFYAITDTEQGITLDDALNAKADEAIVATILALIPAQATPQNQLADKDFVNASISSNTANFIGTFDSLEELEAYPTAGLTNNDYAFVISTDSQGNVVYKRYKWVANTDAWLFEYDLNNSSFTAAQWAAINSGITQGNWDYVLNLVQSWVNIIPDDATAQNPLVARQYLKDRHVILPLLTQEATQEQLQAVYNAIMGAPNDAAFFLTLPDNRGIMPLAVAKSGTQAFAQYADGRFSHELKITLANGVYILEKTDREFATSDLYYDKIAVDAKFAELLDGLENGIIIPALAENLNSPDGVTEQTPFIFRTTGGTTSINSGFAEIKALKGNSVVWNQIFNHNYVRFEMQHDATFYTIERGNKGQLFVSRPYREEDYSSMNIFIYINIPLKAGCKYMIDCTYNITNVRKISVGFYDGVEYLFTGNENHSIFTPHRDFDVTLSRINCSTYSLNNAASGEVIPCLHNLTQMFGAGNEPTTYEEFIARKSLVADEYAYNPGEIISVDVDKIKTIGFNAYNHTTGIARVLGGKEYEIVGAYDSLTLGGETIVPVNGKFTPAVDGDLVVTGGNVNTTCVHLVWSGYRNGEYQPYEEHELDLSWYKQIRKSDGTLLFEDGKLRSASTPHDIVTETQATKRIGVKVFDGTEGWQEAAAGYGFALRKNVYLPGVSPTYGLANALCNYYRIGYATNRAFYFYTLDFDIRDDNYTDVISWKAHLAELYAAGTPLVVIYELAEPIVVDYDARLMNYRVDDFGTEEFVVNDGVTAPVAHTIVYKTNLRDEIRNLPKNYQSQTSMDNALNAIAAALNLTITKTWNDTTKAYQYTVTPNVTPTIEE